MLTIEMDGESMTVAVKPCEVQVDQLILEAKRQLQALANRLSGELLKIRGNVPPELLVFVTVYVSQFRDVVCVYASEPNMFVVVASKVPGYKEGELLF